MAIEKRTTTRGPRYKVRLRRPDGSEYSKTFRTRKEADAFEAAQRTDQARGVWTDPTAGRETVTEYAERWMAARVNLKPLTREQYASLLKLYIVPKLGGYRLGRITPDIVRTWHAGLVLSARPGSTRPARAYRLLRTIMGTAEADGLIGRNPCLLRGVKVETGPERTIASIDEVWALADAVRPVRRAMVLVAGFMGLRFGELLGLQRRHVDLLHGAITVEQQRLEVGRQVVIGTPKSRAGYRTVHVPPVLVPELEQHLERWAEPGPEGFVFVGEKGVPVRRTNWSVEWRQACRAVGKDGFRFHDLRHTANMLVASLPGVTTKDLMARMGHSSSQAALMYQHATQTRDRAIAEALSAQVARTADVVDLDAARDARR
jgi:integrase